jgi:hypothetical protein
MALGKISHRKKLSKGRSGYIFTDTENQPLHLVMGTVITDTSGNSFRVTASHSEDGEYIPLLSLSKAKFPSETFEYNAK